jgi:hypothetical protein
MNAGTRRGTKRELGLVSAYEPEEKQQVPPLGCASVGMTILLHGKGPKAVKRMPVNGPTELSSRPERSAVEGPAVSLPVRKQTLKGYVGAPAFMRGEERFSAP